MRFMMLMIPRGYESAAPGTMPDPAHVAEIMAFNEAMQKAGVPLSLDGFHPPAMGARVTFEGGKPEVTKGPFPGVSEVLGGYWMLQVNALEEAIGWATRCPAGRNEVVEVRQVFEMEDFAQQEQKMALTPAAFEATGCAWGWRGGRTRNEYDTGWRSELVKVKINAAWYGPLPEVRLYPDPKPACGWRND